MMAACIEGCRAATPTTAAEKRRAMSATTASKPAFDLSARMQAIRMEIVANQISMAETNKGAAWLPKGTGSLSRPPPFGQNSPEHSGWTADSKACQGSGRLFSPAGRGRGGLKPS